MVLVITTPPWEARDRRFRDDTDHIVVAEKQPYLFLYTYVPKQAAQHNKERFKTNDVLKKKVEVGGILRKLSGWGGGAKPRTVSDPVAGKTHRG